MERLDCCILYIPFISIRIMNFLRKPSPILDDELLYAVIMFTGIIWEENLAKAVCQQLSK